MIKWLLLISDIHMSMENVKKMNERIKISKIDKILISGDFDIIDNEQLLDDKLIP